MILTASDHGDGTGATLSVSSNSGTASVYVSRFLGSNASRSFVLGGTVAGDGDLELADLENGPYVAVASNAVPEISPPIFFRVTDGTEALHYRCLEAVREYVMSLSLPKVSVDGDDHLIVKLPYRPDLELNVESSTDCCVMYFPKPETYAPASNEDDTVAYLVQVLLIRKLGQRLVEGLPSMLKTRELMGQSMSICPLPDLDEIHTVEVQPGAIFLPEHWKNKYDCSTVVFRCLTEQPSGIL